MDQQMMEDHPRPQTSPCTTRWIACPNGHHLGYRYKQRHHYRFVKFAQARSDDCVIGVEIDAVAHGYGEYRCSICGEWIVWSGNKSGNVYLRDK